MGFFTKPKPIINEEDKKELFELQREAYMKEARILVAERAKEKARAELGIKQKKDNF
jgi:hypothetical protein